ncbi:MAG: hypothetical protein ACRCXE_03300 [Metamycoplasmataceae bacterium]
MKNIKLILIITSLVMLLLGVGCLITSAIIKNEDLAITSATILGLSNISNIINIYLLDSKKEIINKEEVVE